MSRVFDLLKSPSSKYKNPEETRRDVTPALAKYRDLRPSLELFDFDGVKRYLIQFEGTIPVLYKGRTYNIPVQLWLLSTHPDNAPLVFVRPTSTMQLKTGHNVGTNGQVYIDYLEYWEWPTSNLKGLIQALITTFGEECPVFSKGSNHTPPDPTRSQPAPASTGFSGNHHEQIRLTADSVGHSYKALFGRFITEGLTSVRVEDPYIRSVHQIYNFLRFCELLVSKKTALKTILLVTSTDREGHVVQKQRLDQIGDSLEKYGVRLKVEYSRTLHDREIRFDSGWVVKIGRGLDIYKATKNKFTIGFCDFDLRPCHETTVDIFYTKNSRGIVI